jgi:hypothetical protein
MKMGQLLVAAGVLTLVSAASFAQVGSRPQIYSEMVPADKGTAEIGISVNAVLDQSGGGKSQAINLRYLPYLNRNVQAGAGLNYSHFSGGNTFTSVEGVVLYNFMSTDAASVTRTVPYAGASIGTSHVSGDGNSDNVFSWGLQGGAKHFISNDVSLFGEINYRKYNQGNGSKTVLLIGLNTYLR